MMSRLPQVSSSSRAPHPPTPPSSSGRLSEKYATECFNTVHNRPTSKPLPKLLSPEKLSTFVCTHTPGSSCQCCSCALHQRRPLLLTHLLYVKRLHLPFARHLTVGARSADNWRQPLRHVPTHVLPTGVGLQLKEVPSGAEGLRAAQAASRHTDTSCIR